MENPAGAIEIETKLAAAAVTVKLPLDIIEPDCAVIVTVPGPEPVAIPAALTLAMFESEVLHVAELVISCEVPSERFAVA
jgi:hypothetical protein